jgi:hypothetical protein
MRHVERVLAQMRVGDGAEVAGCEGSGWVVGCGLWVEQDDDDDDDEACGVTKGRGRDGEDDGTGELPRRLYTGRGRRIAARGSGGMEVL